MANPTITTRIETLQNTQDRALVACSLSDKESVLETLRDKMKNADSDSNKLRAAELLGKTVGLFKADVVDDKPQKTTAELQAELQEILGQVLVCDGAGKEPALDDGAVH